MIKTSIPLPSNIVAKDTSWVVTYKFQPTKQYTNMSLPQHHQKKKATDRKSQQNIMLIIVCNSVGVVHCEFALLDGQ
jgi:hypothetical protein